MITQGIEIEFLSSDYTDIFTALVSNNIDFKISGNPKESDTTKIIIKPELSVKGFEINIPPNTSEQTLSTICSIFSTRTTFSEKCAMHIHTHVEDITDVGAIFNYYKLHERSIINAAKAADVYVNLNDSNNSQYGVESTFVNMNCYKAFEKHHTVEHRIYKATFDYNKILWALNQTQNIISSALQDE